MVSSKERIVSESRNETPVPSGSPEPTVKSAYEHFREYGRDAPAWWPCGAWELGSHSDGNSSCGKRPRQSFRPRADLTDAEADVAGVVPVQDF